MPAMDVTEIVLCRPPLTSNTLDAAQRARLIRTTRKLGALLGTTPRLADPDMAPLLPIGRSSIDSLRSTSSSEHDHTRNIPQRSRHMPSPSYPFPAHTKSKTKGLYSSCSASSSSSSLVDALPIPKGFSSRPRRSAEAPRPLVLRLNTVPVAHTDVRVPLPMSPQRKPSAALRVAPVPVTPIMPAMPSEAEIKRKRMAKLARTFGENVPTEMVFPTRKPSTTTKAADVEVEMQPRRVLGRTVDVNVSVSIEPPPRRSSHAWVTGSHRGTWTGEWNRKDIREVQQKLRALKAR